MCVKTEIDDSLVPLALSKCGIHMRSTLAGYQRPGKGGCIQVPLWRPAAVHLLSLTSYRTVITHKA